MITGGVSDFLSCVGGGGQVFTYYPTVWHNKLQIESDFILKKARINDEPIQINSCS